MSEYLWPPDIVPSAQDWRVLGNVASFESPFTGSIRTVSRSGGRLGCRLVVPPLKGTDRYRLMSILAALRDRSNYLWVPDFSTTRRGSFPATELLTNNDFSDGTTGWSSSGVLTVADGVARMTATTQNQPAFYRSPNASLTQYAPYALRSFIGDALSGVSLGPYMEAGDNDVSGYSSSARGLRTISAVTTSTTPGAQYPVSVGAVTGYEAGQFVDCHWSSHSRCIPVDAGPNALTYSDQFDNAVWTKSGASVTANGNTAPDGTSTADYLGEDSSTGPHYIVEAGPTISADADYCAYVKVRRQNMARDVQLILGTTGTGNYAYCNFDLGAGTAGTPSVGGTVANVRASIVAKGDTWYECFLIARLPTAATRADWQLMMVSAGSTSYTGGSGGTQGILRLWRGGVAQSSLPTRGAQTTSTALASGASQSGSTIYVKGLPVSTSGLLLAGDRVSCGNQGNIVTASLDSDAAGLGVLQCAIPWRAGLADNDPIIVHQPLVKMRPAGDIAWPTGPGQFSSFEIDLVEDIT